ncbi:MAG: sugar ABC transporter permease [Caldilineaceae bacterium]|nr:sugar ABC transporter permease [Caldilineaceae bacterium]MBP8291244.1 sugar ABC transporter permease [Caldilineaceae bacterium]
MLQQKWARDIYKARYMYLMIAPALIFLALLFYTPVVRGFVMTFHEFRIRGGGEFVGLANYLDVVTDPDFWRVLKNTLIIGGGTLLLSFFLQVVIALLLNEVQHGLSRRTIQTAIYLPHLFSWVVVGGIWISLLSPSSGMINALLNWLGIEPIYFMAKESWAPLVFILTGVWKSLGYGCIIFLAAVTKINPVLYEAAAIDGANRWQLVRSITLPGLYSTMLVVFLLNLLGVLRIFDQSYVMSNPAIMRSTDVVMTYTYRLGIVQLQMDYAATVAYVVLAMTIVLAFFYLSAVRSDVLD